MALVTRSTLCRKDQSVATIVKHMNGKRYVLVGTGFGAFQSKKPNWLLGDLMADTTEGQHTMACVCDKGGRMYWVESNQIVVESVDGHSPREVLDDPA